MRQDIKNYLRNFFLFLLGLIAAGLLVGTIGGVHDNIQYHDWFSVTMWAVFGSIGACAALAGVVTMLVSKPRD